MVSSASAKTKGRPFRIYQRQDLDSLRQLRCLSPYDLTALKAVSAVLPFRVNNYVAETLIDWANVPDDPIYQLTFPQEGMLEPADFRRMIDLVASDAGEEQIANAAHEIQLRMNPHPAGQMDLNVPKFHNEPVPGMQHKYRETVLFFPSPGQTCFAYCTYCFRWAQFVGIKGLQFACREASVLVDYLKEHKEVQSVLFTGGDPMIMRTALIRKYIEPLLTPELDHVTSIRIGTKALPYWPYRFVTDEDADDLLKLFEEVHQSGRQLAIMSHYSHPTEMKTEIARVALKRIQDAGAIVRSQAPVVRHVNDRPAVWSEMWQLQVQQGVIPYYMFVERDTGAKNYFEVPLVSCLEIFQKAYSEITGLGRTVRGPSMSCTPGKVMIDGVQEIAGEKVFALKFLQARDPAWVNQLFFAKFDPQATWMDQLTPAFGGQKFFFEDEMKTIKETGFAQVWFDPAHRHAVAQANHSVAA
jgi:KamA family protein